MLHADDLQPHTGHGQDGSDRDQVIIPAQLVIDSANPTAQGSHDDGDARQGARQREKDDPLILIGGQGVGRRGCGGRHRDQRYNPGSATES